MSSPAIESPPEGVATGHPKGLYVLFTAEMWERFSYYGMRALLILYLIKHLKMTDDDAGMIYGTYVGLVYVTPIFGGYLADRFLGQRKAILVGGMVMAMGHFAMAFESDSLPGARTPDRRQRLLQAEHLDNGRQSLHQG